MKDCKVSNEFIVGGVPFTPVVVVFTLVTDNWDASIITSQFIIYWIGAVCCYTATFPSCRFF